MSGAASESPIVFALDFSNLGEASAAARGVADSVGMLKVGLELFVSAGPPSVGLGRELGLPVFLDLKLHDIPETVERAVAQAADLGARYLTVHASGGRVMLRRAVARAAGSGLEIVAVTVLTSLDAFDLESLGVAATPLGHARRLARLAHEEGVGAFVCSAAEVGAIRKELGDGPTLITPGIRAAARGNGDDQKRVATARQAILDGADWLVVGRPIRDAADPPAAARELAREALRARAERKTARPHGHAPGGVQGPPS